MFFGRRIHAGARREVVRGLGATVQHDDQRHRLAMIAAGYVELVGSTAGLIAECVGEEFCAVRQIGGDRTRRPMAQAGQSQPAMAYLVNKAMQ